MIVLSLIFPRPVSTVVSRNWPLMTLVIHYTFWTKSGNHIFCGPLVNGMNSLCHHGREYKFCDSER